ncbi:5563_t:CDS:2 [Rhizophagus irregularis]|nr:5563_t:CDS:2 [Rhizophagus irregularis]
MSQPNFDPSNVNYSYLADLLIFLIVVGIVTTGRSLANLLFDYAVIVPRAVTTDHFSFSNGYTIPKGRNVFDFSEDCLTENGNMPKKVMTGPFASPPKESLIFERRKET